MTGEERDSFVIYDWGGEDRSLTIFCLNFCATMDKGDINIRLDLSHKATISGPFLR